QRVRHVDKFFAQHLLAFNRVCRCAGNRSLVPNRAGEYYIDIVTDAGVHDAAGQEIFLNSCGNTAGLANYIDCAHNVLAAAAREREVEADAQRSAEQRPFHVVTGKWISSENSIDVACLDKAHQMLT